MAKAYIPWYGGKASAAGRIAAMLPYRQIYCEPFGGSGIVMFTRKTSPIEIYNDVDGRIVNLFRIMQHQDTWEQLQARLDSTLYARAEYERAWEMVLRESHSDEVERAWAFMVMLSMSLNASPDPEDGSHRGSWSRSIRQSKSRNWKNRKDRLTDLHTRLAGVQIECKDAFDVLELCNTPDAVIYIDPPYVLDTLSARRPYIQYPDDVYHNRLIDFCLQSSAAIAVSGHDNPIYNRLVDAGWFRHVYKMNGNVSSQRRDVARDEIVWLNVAAYGGPE